MKDAQWKDFWNAMNEANKHKAKYAPIAVGEGDIELEQELATSKQVGGDHYTRLAIQPAEYNQRNGLGFCEACVVKYVSRHKHKNGKQDIEKAIHFLNLLLEIEYKEQ
jgi:hypothetical protein